MTELILMLIGAVVGAGLLFLWARKNKQKAIALINMDFEAKIDEIKDNIEKEVEELKDKVEDEFEELEEDVKEKIKEFLDNLKGKI